MRSWSKFAGRIAVEEATGVEPWLVNHVAEVAIGQVGHHRVGVSDEWGRKEGGLEARGDPITGHASCAVAVLLDDVAAISIRADNDSFFSVILFLFFNAALEVAVAVSCICRRERELGRERVRERES